MSVRLYIVFTPNKLFSFPSPDGRKCTLKVGAPDTHGKDALSSKEKPVPDGTVESGEPALSR